MGPAVLLVTRIYVLNARNILQFVFFHQKKNTFKRHTEYAYNSYKIPLLTQIGYQLLIQNEYEKRHIDSNK
jgi:hypothetical protein